MKKIIFLFLIFIGSFSQVYAVPPPDFIIQVFSNLGVYFAIFVTFLGSIFLGIINYIKIFFSNLSKTKLIIFGLIIISIISFLGAYFYDNYKQKLLKDEILKKINLSKKEKLNITKSEYNKKIELKKNVKQNISKKKLGKEEIGNKFSNNITISNKDFLKIFKNFSSNKDYLILDAREDLEVQIGKMPGSMHIRFAELKNGDYKKLYKYNKIYVYCRSGMRGKEVALFLRGKGLDAISLEKGAKGWYDFGGKWNGEILFSKVFTNDNYKKLFMKKDLKQEFKKGVFLVDVRNIKKYKLYHLKNSINIPLVDLPKNKWEKYIQQIPKKSEIITICDDYMNCFYAKIIGIELEKQGYKFKGRYSMAYN